MSTQETKGKGRGKAELPPLKNTLEQARSPYLLQHKSNPVHWQQWTPETIARAREEDKMIFLSVGYSTCHWCGVQAEESFSNEVSEWGSRLLTRVNVLTYRHTRLVRP